MLGSSIKKKLRDYNSRERTTGTRQSKELEETQLSSGLMNLKETNIREVEETYKHKVRESANELKEFSSISLYWV